MSWFFINSDSLTVYIYGPGSHPTTTRTFECADEFRSFVERLLSEGYELIKDQAGQR
jgi:hypothetical protein